MGTAYLIQDGFYRRYGLQTDAAVEYYVAKELFPNEFEDPSTITGLPQPGGTLGNGLPIQTVELVKLFTSYNPHVALYKVSANYVTSGTIIPFGSESWTDDTVDTLRTPQYVQFFTQTDTQSITNYKRNPDLIEKRPGCFIRVSFEVNISKATLDNFVAANIGKRYIHTTSNINYLFTGCKAVRMPNGFLRGTASWYTNATAPAQTASAVDGMDVALPALSNLDEYVAHDDVFPPIVTVRPITRIPLGGTNYPWS